MAATMTSPAPFFRNFSNKENSSFSSMPALAQPSFSTSTTHKHRIGGIGRAPKRSQTHNAKPYDRKSSVARAKVRATSPVKGEPELKDVGSRRTRRAIPSPIITSAPVLQPPQPRIRIANIPIRLPRPRIPPVQCLPGEMSHIPIEWALPRLRTHFPALLAVSSQYRPQPTHSIPAESSTSQHTFAFAIPQLLSGDDVSELEAKVKGREPDTCLAIKGKGREGGVARLLPVNSLVYASQCSYWPRSTDASLSANPESGPSSSALTSITEESTSDQEGSSSGSDSDATITSLPRSTSSSSASDSPSTSTSHILHLPLLSLTIPHPASFPTLHTHLHLPSRPLLSSLLALPPSCATPATITAELERSSLEDLMQKLEHMHGFWSNLCALGIHGEASWKGLDEAWGLVVGVVAARSRRAPVEEVKVEME